MFFGSLCMFMFGYGAASLLTKVSLPGPPSIIPTVVNKANTAVVELTNELDLPKGVGIFSPHVDFVLSEHLPETAWIEEVEAVLHRKYEISMKEVEMLKELIDPICAFEMYSAALPPQIAEPQRRLMLRPVLGFLSTIHVSRVRI